MKRYFFCPTSPPAWVPSSYHYINFPAGGCIIVMMDSHMPPDPSWVEASHLLDATTVMPAGILTHLQSLNAGILATDNMYQVAMKLAAVHAFFHP